MFVTIDAEIASVNSTCLAHLLLQVEKEGKIAKVKCLLACAILIFLLQRAMSTTLSWLPEENYKSYQISCSKKIPKTDK